jgi:hypothetical protein
MPYLVKADLTTHLYQEVIDEIIRNQSDIATEAINAAVDFAKSYLSKYQLDALFGVGNTAPTVVSPMLKNQVKNIACWYILTLGNANVELALFEKLYDDAVSWLRDVQKGMSAPDWPYRNTDERPKPENGDSVAHSSNPKRKNHF